MDVRTGGGAARTLRMRYGPAGVERRALHEPALQTLQRVLSHADAEALQRTLNAWSIGTASGAIATAAALGDVLAMLSCTLERHAIPLNVLPTLRRMPVGERSGESSVRCARAIRAAGPQD